MPDTVSSIDGRTFQTRGLAGPEVPGDLVVLGAVFGFAPVDMLGSAPGFSKGECVAGTFAPAPTYVQVRRRRTREGGSDLQVPRRAGG
jgi:hypothetical protein